MGQWKRILVGVDGSPASRTALEWASDEAVHHGSELVVLTAWLPTHRQHSPGRLARYPRTEQPMPGRRRRSC